MQPICLLLYNSAEENDCFHKSVFRIQRKHICASSDEGTYELRAHQYPLPAGSCNRGFCLFPCHSTGRSAFFEPIQVQHYIRLRFHIDILPNRKKIELIKYFRSFENRTDVKYVVMDMNPHFREAAQTCFPSARIVVDRYHVTRQAIWALENIRKVEQKALSKPWRKFCKHYRRLLCKSKDQLTDEERQQLRIILGLSNRIEIAYDLKNDFLEFMHSPDYKTAKERLALWLYHAENSNLPEFDACIKALHNWSEYILNAFDVPYSNGFTEGCNNKTKVLKRVCFGVSCFSTFRNRILHCASAS